MSLVFIDGFDHYASSDTTDKYPIENGGNIDTVEPRTGLGCLKMTGATTHITITVAAKATYIVGFGIKLDGDTNSDAEDLVTFYEDSYGLESQVSLQYTGDKKFRVVRGDEVIAQAVLGETTDQFDLNDGWHYIEFKAFINDTTGSFEVRFDEENILSAINVDTKVALAEADEIKHIRISRIETTVPTTFIDDLYVCDTTGIKNNDFLGDCQVHTIFPKADGALEDWATQAGTDSFAMVDENPPDDDTTYVQSNVTTEKDSFDMDDVAGMTTILGVQLIEYAKFVTGSAGINHLTRVGGNNFIGADTTLTSAYLFYMNIWEDDPDISSAWTPTGLNAAEFGMEVV